MKGRQRSVKCTAFLLKKTWSLLFMMWLIQVCSLKSKKVKDSNILDVSLLHGGRVAVLEHQRFLWRDFVAVVLVSTECLVPNPQNKSCAVTAAGGSPPTFPSLPFNLTAMFLKATLSYFQGRGGGNAILLPRWVLLISGDSVPVSTRLQCSC